MNEQTAMAEPVESTTDQPIQARPDSASNAMISPQMGGGCGRNGTRMSQNPGGAEGTNANGGMNAFVYAIGRVEARFPNLSVEKEFAQATGRAETVGKTDQQAFHEVLSQRQNRYLVRQLCWVLT